MFRACVAVLASLPRVARGQERCQQLLTGGRQSLGVLDHKRAVMTSSMSGFESVRGVQCIGAMALSSCGALLCVYGLRGMVAYQIWVL